MTAVATRRVWAIIPAAGTIAQTRRAVRTGITARER